MRRLRAFSLIEAVGALFIVFVLLGLCCDLFKQYSTTLNFSAAKTNSLTSMQVALQAMLDDARQATSFVSPASVGVPSQTLDLFMADPKLLNSPPRSATPSDLIEVKYYLSDGSVYPSGTLLRDSTPGGGSTSTSKVADSVSISGFSVVGLNSWGTGVNAVEIQLSLQESFRVLVVSSNSARFPF